MPKLIDNHREMDDTSELNKLKHSYRLCVHVHVDLAYKL